MGKQLSLCMPNSDMRWTNITTPFESWDTSKLMYSKRDERFYMLAPGGKYLCSWDLNFKKDKKPKFHELLLHDDIPGKMTIVKCYSEYTTEGVKPPTVMVFREEETICGKKNMRHTKDIGDLCIFISKGEDFCVEASSCNLEPNSVFVHGRLFGTFNLTERSFARYEYPEGTPDMIPHSPYWLPPYSS
ncbi:unnamed protein product [Microthlaspi erraticum]|uniref:KIB1-4 beta-propeller domain-containing protein n=1 Tax=Microthlaspi erraticum TaxID=1685480 RepID=A0A6D2HHG3_9BRAS|nr:unnamed protein product [Microthlaspi erraticum]